MENPGTGRVPLPYFRQALSMMRRLAEGAECELSQRAFFLLTEGPDAGARHAGGNVLQSHRVVP